MKQRLLVVEDDAAIRTQLQVLLERNGYEALALDGFGDVVRDVLAFAPDLVLLDLNLPGVDGHYICRELRAAAPALPVVVVTSRDTETDELLAMNFGADDFVTKPYSPQVLLARIGSVLRRALGPQAGDALLAHRGLVLDTARCKVSFRGRDAELTKNELRMLALLLRNPGTVVERRRLQEELWASDEFIDDNTLTVNVSHLRRTLGAIGAQGFVRTVRGVGYAVE